MGFIARRHAVTRAPTGRAVRILPLLIVLLATPAPVLSQGSEPRILRQAPLTVLQPRRDVLILRNGGYEQGELIGCSGGTCSLGGKSHRRDDIFLIGLGVAGSDLPPVVDDPLQDSIHLRNAPAFNATLHGINAEMVVSARGSDPRKEVVWVHVALPQPKPPGYSERPITPAPPDPGSSDTRVQPPLPGQDNVTGPRETRRSPPPTGGGTLQHGALWIGTVHWTAKHTPTHRVTSRATVRLRETRVHDGSIELIHEGSMVTVMHSTLGGDCIFAGQGTSPADGPAGFLEREQKAGPNGEMRWGAWTYELRIKPVQEPIWTETCPDVAWPGTARTYTHTFGGEAGSTWQAAVGDANRDPRAPRLLDGNRMTGRYTAHERDSLEDTVAWSICRADVSCPPLETSEASSPPPDICPIPRNERALLDLALDQQQLLMNQLAAKFDEYFRLANEAQQYKADFEHATTHCQLWSFAKFWASFVLSNYAPTSLRTFGRSPVAPATGVAPPTQYRAEPGKELANFLGFVEKLLGDDGSWLLPNSEFKEWFSAEDAYDAFTTVYANVRPSSYAEQVDSLRSCGAPTLQARMDGAIHYLRLMEQVEPLMRQVNTLMNDLRKKDEQVSELWNKYDPACLEYAKCKGLPTSMCASPPSTAALPQSPAPSRASPPAGSGFARP